VVNDLDAKVLEAIAEAETKAKGKALSDGQKQALYKQATKAPVSEGGWGKELPKLTSDAAIARSEELALEQMAKVGPGGKPIGVLAADSAHLKITNDIPGAGAVGEIEIGQIADADLAPLLKGRADSLAFSETAEAAYHVHVHDFEIELAHLDPTAKSSAAHYMSVARRTVREGKAAEPFILQNGTRSVIFSMGRGDVIVYATPEGNAYIATFIPRARKK
jgi:hypothetical protein